MTFYFYILSLILLLNGEIRVFMFSFCYFMLAGVTDTLGEKLQPLVPLKKAVKVKQSL